MLKSIFAICALSLSLSHAKPVIAITKIAPHPSLDAIERGVRDGLRKSGIDADILADNAQGNITTATQIAKKYVGKKVDLIIPITTPSAQTVYQAAKPMGIPVVFAGVSDPVAAKLVDCRTNQGDGITGVSDLSPLKDQIDLIQLLQPTIKKIGVIYNPSEANSVALLRLFTEQAKQRGVDVKEFPCTSMSDLMMVSKSIQSKVDAVYLPNDNTVISGLDLILKNVTDLPIYAADPDSVDRGCLACVAFGQYEMGVKAGELAALVLKGKPVSEIPVVQATDSVAKINKSVADRLGIIIPKTTNYNVIGE
ncbi:MAG: ABC transporter substrate-binding protein [Candidatus Paracaedibacteraceae bacterium]|nr:ABC transporter substrate-binding protein [Candidatus Paracaedibacteraceae bacterium]